MDKKQMRDIVRSTDEYQEGLLTDAQVEEIVEAVHSSQDAMLELELVGIASMLVRHPQTARSVLDMYREEEDVRDEQAECRARTTNTATETRRDLFEDVIVALDAARLEAETTGSPTVARRIGEVLMPFIEAERDRTS